MPNLGTVAARNQRNKNNYIRLLRQLDPRVMKLKFQINYIKNILQR